MQIMNLLKSGLVFSSCAASFSATHFQKNRPLLSGKSTLFQGMVKSCKAKVAPYINKDVQKFFNDIPDGVKTVCAVASTVASIIIIESLSAKVAVVVGSGCCAVIGDISKSDACVDDPEL